jgi:hypothetical protein
MSTSINLIAKPKNRAVTSVRIFTWLAVALFLTAFLLVPRGITVFWSLYLLLFGPVIAVDLAAIVSFVVCRLTRRKISFAYFLISLAVMAGVWYITWFELRLRWYEVF